MVFTMVKSPYVPDWGGGGGGVALTIDRCISSAGEQIRTCFTSEKMLETRIIPSPIISGRGWVLGETSKWQ